VRERSKRQHGETMRSKNEDCIAAHRANIRRYRSLLSPAMTDLERQYVHRRISEECDEIVRIGGTAEPIDWDSALAR
jgi:hypothetical protein